MLQVAGGIIIAVVVLCVGVGILTAIAGLIFGVGGGSDDKND